MKFANCFKCKDNKSGFQFKLTIKIFKFFIIKISLGNVDEKKCFILFNFGTKN